MISLIREAEERDIKPMADLDRLCFAHPWSENAFSEELTKNQLAFYLVAQLGEEVIGYAGLWAIFEEGHITNVAVHPSHREKGLGRLLLTKLMEAWESQGIKAFTLEVRPSNAAAIALYGKLGFQTMGRRPGYYEDNGEDALILWYRKE
jgi:ribosomal-protein-alanine N-acetyltransferase